VPSQTELIAEAVDLIVVMEGGHRTRRVKDLVRVRGLSPDGSFDLQSLLTVGYDLGHDLDDAGEIKKPPE
jgi:Flp pilus assembly CpaF family ATPase